MKRASIILAAAFAVIALAWVPSALAQRQGRGAAERQSHGEAMRGAYEMESCEFEGECEFSEKVARESRGEQGRHGSGMTREREMEGCRGEMSGRAREGRGMGMGSMGKSGGKGCCKMQCREGRGGMGGGRHFDGYGNKERIRDRERDCDGDC